MYGPSFPGIRRGLIEGMSVIPSSSATTGSFPGIRRGLIEGRYGELSFSSKRATSFPGIRRGLIEGCRSGSRSAKVGVIPRHPPGVRSRSIPDLDESGGRYLRYRQLIECGETQDAIGQPNHSQGHLNQLRL